MSVKYFNLFTNTKDVNICLKNLKTMFETLEKLSKIIFRDMVIHHKIISRIIFHIINRNKRKWKKIAKVSYHLLETIDTCLAVHNMEVRLNF